MAHSEYEVSTATLKDIINKIPEDKWGAVMFDLGHMLKQISSTMEFVKVSAEALNIDPTDIVHLGDSMKWVDDGKCENSIAFTDGENEVGEIKFTESGLEVK